MKTPFQFKVGIDGGLYTYFYVGDDNPIITKNWPDISEAWTKTLIPSPKFYLNHQFMEDIAVYLGLVWRLCEEKPCYAIPNYYRDDASQSTGLDFDLVKWEYEIVTWEYAIEVENVCDKGFVRARACPVSRFNQGHELGTKIPHDKAGLFRIDLFEQLVLLQNPTLSDASSEISLFFIPSERKTELLFFLNTDQCPVLSNFLKPGELFIDIGVGIDRGYYDFISIKSAIDIEDRLQNLVWEYQQAIADYEDNFSNLKTREDALQALAKLALGKL
jgi:hypothetical protein